MRSRVLNPDALARLLIWAWTDDSIDLDTDSNILQACDLLWYKDDLRRLFELCERKGISYEWEVTAIVWYLNNL